MSSPFIVRPEKIYSAVCVLEKGRCRRHIRVSCAQDALLALPSILFLCRQAFRSTHRPNVSPEQFPILFVTSPNPNRGQRYPRKAVDVPSPSPHLRRFRSESTSITTTCFACLWHSRAQSSVRTSHRIRGCHLTRSESHTLDLVEILGV